MRTFYQSDGGIIVETFDPSQFMDNKCTCRVALISFGMMIAWEISEDCKVHGNLCKQPKEKP